MAFGLFAQAPAPGIALDTISQSLEPELYASTVANRQKQAQAGELGNTANGFEGYRDLFTQDAWLGMQQYDYIMLVLSYGVVVVLAVALLPGCEYTVCICWCQAPCALLASLSWLCSFLKSYSLLILHYASECSQWGAGRRVDAHLDELVHAGHALHNAVAARSRAIFIISCGNTLQAVVELYAVCCVGVCM